MNDVEARDGASGFPSIALRSVRNAIDKTL